MSDEMIEKAFDKWFMSSDWQGREKVWFWV